jgi:SMP-30/gluconolaconase/LRE-like protein
LVAENIDYANGLAISNDGKLLYVGESKKHRLLRFEIGRGGELSHRNEFVKLADILADGRMSEFTPDGIRLDKYGRLFVALYNGGGFAVLTGDGRLEKMVRLPAAHHSNPAISADGNSVVVTSIDDMPDGSNRGELFKVSNPCPARVLGPRYCFRQGTSAPDSKIIRRLLKLRQNASVFAQRCADFSSDSSDRKRSFTSDPWWTSSPVLPYLGFRYTQVLQ